VLCDFCGKPTKADTRVLIPLGEIKQAVRNGYNPFMTISRKAKMMGWAFGLTDKEVYQDWCQKVLADTTDWSLCRTCAKNFRTENKGSSASKAKHKEAKTTNWWQFWK